MKNFCSCFSSFCILLFSSGFCLTSFCQQAKTVPPASPKLVVGIVVDQMRYDYIYRYWDKFGNDGFKRLVKEGFFCRNTHYNYVPTYTGPGHASVYTGTTPSVNGIAGNVWYSRDEKRFVYCSEDKTVQSVGSANSAGQMSPRNLITTTMGDQLRLASNMKSKVIGIALKDRGAILPAGHSANAGYWFDDESGNWISSTHYMKELPSWMKDFNGKKHYDAYLNQQWNTLLPIAQYTESLADNNRYESSGHDSVGPVFPYNLPELKRKSGIGVIRNTPFGNSFTKDVSIEAIKGENLGKGPATDFLCISFSSTDYIGHLYGPQSVEVEDCYLRLDRDIAEFLKFLDTWAGKNNVLLFLTADHAACDVSSYLLDLKIPAGYAYFKSDADSLKKYFSRTYGDSLVLAYTNQQIYLNHKTILERNLNKAAIEDFISSYFSSKPGIARVITASTMSNCSFNDAPESLVQKGYHQKRSGDVMLVFEPGWVEYGKTGCTHGSPYPYDTHVPLFFYGWNISPGSSAAEVDITDIAATVSMLLNIQAPNGCTGKVIPDFFVKD